jgi:hypothetical protein
MIVPPKIPLPTLADEILAELPAMLQAHPDGPIAGDVADHMAASIANVRQAFLTLEAEGKAKIVRRKRSLHLVGMSYPGRICVICRTEFHSTRKGTKTCSHSCGRYLAWQNEDMRARHAASVRAAHSKPDVREHLTKINRERCADPEWRQRMSDQNRRSWRKPESRAKRILSMEDAWKGDRAVERREKARQRKLRLWSDPEWKRKAIEGMKTGKRGRFKRAVIAAVTTSEMDAPELAASLGLPLEKVKIIWRRAFRMGEVNRQPSDGRKSRPTRTIQSRTAA